MARDGISGYCLDPQTLLMEASSEAKSGNWLITYGTKDEVLPVEKTRVQIKVLVAGGLPIDTMSFKSHIRLTTSESFLSYVIG